jgi:hypothetical protein
MDNFSFQTQPDRLSLNTTNQFQPKSDVISVNTTPIQPMDNFSFQTQPDRLSLNTTNQFQPKSDVISVNTTPVQPNSDMLSLNNEPQIPETLLRIENFFKDLLSQENQIKDLEISIQQQKTAASENATEITSQIQNTFEKNMSPYRINQIIDMIMQENAQRTDLDANEYARQLKYIEKAYGKLFLRRYKDRVKRYSEMMDQAVEKKIEINSKINASEYASELKDMERYYGTEFIRRYEARTNNNNNIMQSKMDFNHYFKDIMHITSLTSQGIYDFLLSELVPNIAATVAISTFLWYVAFKKPAVHVFYFTPSWKLKQKNELKKWIEIYFNQDNRKYSFTTSLKKANIVLRSDKDTNSNAFYNKGGNKESKIFTGPELVLYLQGRLKCKVCIDSKLKFNDLSKRLKEMYGEIVQFLNRFPQETNEQLNYRVEFWVVDEKKGYKNPKYTNQISILDFEEIMLTKHKN